MTDSDSPETSSNQLPEKHGKKHRSMFESSKPKPPPRDFFKDEPPQPDINLNDREALFRTAAIRLAEAEEEIANQLKEKLPDRDGNKHVESKYAGDSMVISRMGNSRRVTLRTRDIIPTVAVNENTIELYDGINEDTAKAVGIDTRQRVTIFATICDNQAQEAVEEYLSEHEASFEDNLLTDYFFSASGECKKFIIVPREISLGPDRLPSKYQAEFGILAYSSEMTEGDFEIAGRVLAILKEKLTLSQGNTEQT